MSHSKRIGVSPYGMTGVNSWYSILGDYFNPDIVVLDYDTTPDDLDFVIFDGGSDVYPVMYGEQMNGSHKPHIKRDYIEHFLFHRYFQENTNYIGICRGIQFLNIMMNGTLHQDLYAVEKGHGGNHVVLTKHSILKGYVPSSFEVNLLHHQAVKHIGISLVPTLIEPQTDVIEGIESHPHSYPNDKIRAVQCHPEFGRFRHADDLIRYLFRCQDE